ncbi:hypothetical protein, partial [Streptomyces sp. 12257]|uniref:hypothetical protein n=1 Tax=Streptomyces sp. 12257 TaxID=3041009 RepID=UPI0032C15A69
MTVSRWPGLPRATGPRGEHAGALPRQTGRSGRTLLGAGRHPPRRRGPGSSVRGALSWSPGLGGRRG